MHPSKSWDLWPPVHQHINQHQCGDKNMSHIITQQMKQKAYRVLSIDASLGSWISNSNALGDTHIWDRRFWTATEELHIWKCSCEQNTTQQKQLGPTMKNVMEKVGLNLLLLLQWVGRHLQWGAFQHMVFNSHSHSKWYSACAFSAWLNKRT